MANAPSPIRLLVVDADTSSRTVLRRRFSRIGYEVMEADTGAKALSLISMIPFDLVLLDMQLGGGDALEVLRQARENRSPEQLPIIALTADAADEDVVEALDHGANDCLAKPVDVEIAYARAEMQVRRKAPSGPIHRELETNLVVLQEAVVEAENAAALLPALGAEVRAPLSSLLRAAIVFTSVCRTPELKPKVEAVETASNTLDALLVRALELGDRRIRAPKTSVRVLSADDDAQSRFGMREMLHATTTAVELVDVSTGLQAALAAEASFFDLILMNVATAESLAGIRAIRRAERQNKHRRTPILAITNDGEAGARAMAAGADLHMPQPVTAQNLLSALAHALSRESRDLSAVA